MCYNGACLNQGYIYIFLYTASCEAKKESVTVWERKRKNSVPVLSKPRLCRQPEVLFSWREIFRSAFFMHLLYAISYVN